MSAINRDEYVECKCDGIVHWVPRDLFAQMVMRMPYSNRKFLRYKEGPDVYGVSEREFYDLAHRAQAVYKPSKVALVKIEEFDKYLEYFKGM